MVTMFKVNEKVVHFVIIKSEGGAGVHCQISAMRASKVASI